MPLYRININCRHTTLWFKSWETRDMTTYLLSCLGLVLFGIMHEGLACYRSSQLAKLHPKQHGTQTAEEGGYER